VVLLKEAHLDSVFVALEEVEYVGQLSGIDPNACVLHHEFKSWSFLYLVLILGRDHNLPSVREFDCVLKQVKQYLLQPLFVSVPSGRHFASLFYSYL